MSKYLRIIGLSVLSTVLPAILPYMSTVSLAQNGPATCPCDISAYNMTPECWVDPYSTNPQFYTDLVPPYTQVGLGCSVSNYNGMIADTQIIVGFGSPEGGWFCEIDGVGDLPQPCAAQIVHQNLTQDQFEACLCDLEAYTTQLNLVNGISVSGGPQFICTSGLRCPRSPAPIPTISELGMIAMAGVLGIIGFLVIRRRKVAA